MYENLKLVYVENMERLAFILVYSSNIIHFLSTDKKATLKNER